MIHCLSEEVHSAAFWRFANGTFFNYRERTFKKTSPISATYLDKLHGLTIQYFCPFKSFTYVGPRTNAFEGTVVDELAMEVIQLDEFHSIFEYKQACSKYLDHLRIQVELENSLAARPNFSSQPSTRAFRVSRLALLFDVLMLPCRTLFYVCRSGVPAAFQSLRLYPGWLRSAWKVARWDFWNNPTPKPFTRPYIRVIGKGPRVSVKKEDSDQ